MRFGIRLLQYLGSPRDLVELGILAEQAGFDFAWFPNDKFMHHAWPVMVAVAERTQRITIGPNGAEPYTLAPSEVATFMATLDTLSNGRTALGFGMHGTRLIEAMGIALEDPATRLREAITVIRRLWRGEAVEFRGQVFRWSPDCRLRFMPIRDRIPIYLAVPHEELLPLTGELGDGSLPMLFPPQSAGTAVQRVHAGARAAGRDPGEVDICGAAWFSLTPTGAGAITDTLRDMIAYFGPQLSESTLATIGLRAADFRAIEERLGIGDLDGARAGVTPAMWRLAVTGSPRDAIGAIEALAHAGVTQVSVGGPLGPDPRETIRLFGETIIPHFR
jgi:5,10-methylenetetrahydromethanopterin reductase